MNSEPCLNVFVGCPPLLRKLPEGPCLILDADQAALDVFQQQNLVQEHSNAVVLQSVVLAGPDDDVVIWRRFSDSRFNGVWARSTWHEMAPNLSELDQSSIQASTFATVLEQPNLIADSWGSIRLFLRQGDPVRILYGAGSWLKQCSSILLRYPAMPGEKQREFEVACAAAGFMQPAVDDNAWVPKKSDWSEIQVSTLQLLFDASSYREIRPDLQDWSDSALLEHWLNSSDPKSLVDEMRRSQRMMPRVIDEVRSDDPILEALRSIFPYDYYRSTRTDLSEMTDENLLIHFCRCGVAEGVELSDGIILGDVLEALRSIFPYQFYRQINPLVRDLDDRSLVSHFCCFGLDQGIDLSEDAQTSALHSFPSDEIQQLRVRVKQLEKLLAASSHQLSALQNIFLDADGSAAST